MVTSKNLSANQKYKMYCDAVGDNAMPFKEWLVQARAEGVVNGYNNADGENIDMDAPKPSMIKADEKSGIPLKNIVVGVAVVGIIAFVVYTYMGKGNKAVDVAAA